jgi:TPR repeat protein
MNFIQTIKNALRLENDASKQCDLGVKYETNGRYQEAVTWFRKAAEQGLATAQYNLAVMYANGRGVTKDDQEAVTWYRRAAEQGLALAQHNLAVMYANAQGVPKDDQEAETWYRKAAEQGLATAQNNLAFMYQNGRGVTKDDQEAVIWYRKAAEQGLATAQNNLAFMYQNGRGVTKDDHEAVTWYREAAKQGHADSIRSLQQLKDREYVECSVCGRTNARYIKDLKRKNPDIYIISNAFIGICPICQKAYCVEHAAYSGEIDHEVCPIHRVKLDVI